MKKKKVGIFVCILMISVIIYPSLKSETMEDQFSGKTSYEKFYKSNQINKIVPLGNWLDETYVVSTESDNFSYTPVLVADHDRNVHIAWTESTLVGQWYVLYKCLPKDATWDDNPWDDYPTELVSTESDPSAGPANPTMVVDESGTVHIAWKDGTDINSEDDGHWDIFYRQKSTGGNWTDNDYEQVSVETDEESCNYPTMVVDSEGTIHVVWISNDNSANGEMHYNYKPLGGDWTHTELIGSSSIDHDEPDLAIDESDNLHLVFTTQAFGGGTKQVYYRNRPYAGTWSSATKVSEASNDDSINPKLALSTDDPPTVHVTWQENYGLYHDEIFYRECEPVWNPTELVTDLSEACELPSIAVRPMLLSNHRVMIAFSHNVDPYDSEWHIQYMYKNVGDTWPTTYTTISDDATEFATSPDLCSERYYYSYRTHCAWSDTTPYSGSGPYNDIVYKRTSPLVAITVIRPDSLIGWAMAIENPQEMLLENLPWWMDIHCKWLFIGQRHAEGVIDQLRPDETKVITHSKFFGFGPAKIFGQVDEAIIKANAFIIGPFVFIQKNQQ
ncbi:MAG: hypothetical protein JSW60_09015 [Thermoplasmatales archaeon]|nr:MAG: hypothetical protein JSW60_09015 [Thermoplasmatales archaeon]